MEFFPMLEFGWLNGWLLLVIFFGIFGVIVLTCPKEVIARLYEEEEWKKRGIFFKITGLIGVLFFFFSSFKSRLRYLKYNKKYLFICYAEKKKDMMIRVFVKYLVL